MLKHSPDNDKNNVILLSSSAEIQKHNVNCFVYDVYYFLLLHFGGYCHKSILEGLENDIVDKIVQRKLRASCCTHSHDQTRVDIYLGCHIDGAEMFLGPEIEILEDGVILYGNSPELDGWCVLADSGSNLWIHW